MIYIITVQKTQFELGESVFFQFKIINPTTEPVTIRFSGGYYVDYEIKGPPLVNFRLSDYIGGGYHCAVWEVVLAGGDTWTISFRHEPDDQYLPPGFYLIHAWLDGHGHASLWIVVGVTLLIAIPLIIGICVIHSIVIYHRKRRKTG